VYAKIRHVPTVSSANVARDEKERALARVEASKTFSGQEQLKSFLRFVCSYEISGRGNELHEYLIGTEVFGQDSGYSTAENSIVRNRAYSLRHRLQDLYASEIQDAEIRIEVPKGSYCPRFVRVNSEPPPIAQTDTTVAASPRTIPSFSGKSKRWSAASYFLLVCLASGFFGWRFIPRKIDSAVSPVIRQAWGPLLDQSANTIVCVSTGPELLVRSLPSGFQGGSKLVPSELGLESWYGQRYKQEPGEHLYVVPNYNTPLWGDASGAVTVSHVLARAGIETQLLPERVVDSFALRDRNVILLGRPQESPAAKVFLANLYYNIRWFPEFQDLEVYFSDPKTGHPSALPHNPTIARGIITVIGSLDHDGIRKRMVILSGTDSAGTIAAAEFFSSPERMQEFKDRLLHDGYKSFPTTYQIVISTETHNILPFNSSMEAYKVAVH
jgi:hypothetical protein